MNVPTRTTDNFNNSQKGTAIKRYSKPILFKLGSVTTLTTGGSGNLGDVTGENTPGKIPPPPG